MSVTIYHNPACGTSRNTLAMIRQSGEEPEVIEYLKTPPAGRSSIELIAAMGIPVRALLREKGTPYAELGLGDPEMERRRADRFHAGASDPDQPADRRHAKGHKLCRPSEAVLDLLPNPVRPFVKEDGEVVTPEKS